MFAAASNESANGDRAYPKARISRQVGRFVRDPIAVGIAAFLLQDARLRLCSGAACALKRQDKMKDVLVRIADKTQQSVSRDGYSYVALNLFAVNLFGKGKGVIDVTLKELLRRSSD
ncbi:hypothetical protein VTH06DRAFT_5039 [Thermothelomyces fergusii]